MSVDFRTTVEAQVQRLRAKKERIAELRRAARFLLGLLLLAFALGFLVFLNWLLRGAGLWGDLAFAIIVVTSVLWALRRAAKPLQNDPSEKVWAFPRAFAAAIFVLMGVPVAYVTRPLGAVLFALPIGLWALARLTKWRWRRPGRVPPLWGVTLVSVALLGIALLLAPSVTSGESVPRGVPQATIEGGQLDAALADRFRPLLFLDSGEQRYPLDIEAAIADDRMDMCRKAVPDDVCDDVERADEIDESFDYIKLEEGPTPPRGGGEGSAYYFHVVRNGERVYVDYWWFFSRNPSPVADKVFCGPGLRLPPFTCQEHTGDWEGVTVVLAACAEGSLACEEVEGELLGPVEVRYAQHEHVSAYGWTDTLAPLWPLLPRPKAPALLEIWNGLVLPMVRQAGPRPVVFVARNSHASYPDACFGDCKQEVRDLFEARFDGAVPWVNNLTCEGCLKPLPLTASGERALWSAFPGRWGAQRCILAGAYCDLSGAPRGPSFQQRYLEPAGEAREICLRTVGGGPRLAPCSS
jgi:hypothetical protein